jgi:hypothetical protein
MVVGQKQSVVDLKKDEDEQYRPLVLVRNW